MTSQNVWIGYKKYEYDKVKNHTIYYCFIFKYYQNSLEIYKTKTKTKSLRFRMAIVISMVGYKKYRKTINQLI